MRSIVGALALGATLLLATAPPLSAHGGLKSSVPVAGAQVASVPRELRLTSSDASPLHVTRVGLVGADSQAGDGRSNRTAFEPRWRLLQY